MGRTVIHNERIRDLMRSDAARAALERRARAIAAACGDGYEAEADIESNRASAAVYTATAEARADNAENHTILRNLDAGR